MTNAHLDNKLPSFSTAEELAALIGSSEAGGEDIEMTPAEWQRLQADIERDAALRRKAS